MQIGDIIPFKAFQGRVYNAKLIQFLDDDRLKFEWIEGPWDMDTFDILASDLQENSF